MYIFVQIYRISLYQFFYMCYKWVIRLGIVRSGRGNTPIRIAKNGLPSDTFKIIRGKSPVFIECRIENDYIIIINFGLFAVSEMIRAIE
jgi:hypothetical protein